MLYQGVMQLYHHSSAKCFISPSLSLSLRGRTASRRREKRNTYLKRLLLVPDVDELFREQEVCGVKNIYIKAPNCYINPSWSRQALFRLPSTESTQQSTQTQKRKKKRDARNTMHLLLSMWKNVFLRNHINLKWKCFQRIFAEKPPSSQKQVRRAENAGHLSLKDRGPMCSLKVSKDESGKREGEGVREWGCANVSFIVTDRSGTFSVIWMR